MTAPTRYATPKGPHVSDQPTPITDDALTLEPVERDAGAFLVLLSNLSEGAIAEDAAAQLKRVTAGVREHGKRGSITITVTVEPVKKSNNAVTVSGSITAKAPAPTRAAEFMFTGPDGELLRDRPDQHALIAVNRKDNI